MPGALYGVCGVHVTLALATDGEDAEPYADEEARAALVATRQAELAAALGHSPGRAAQRPPRGGLADLLTAMAG